MPEADVTPAKRTIRNSVITARAGRDAVDVEAAGFLIAERLSAVVEGCGADTVTAYIAVGGEPSTQSFINRMHKVGVTVLLPLLGDDFDLEWARYEPTEFRAGRFGLIEPTTPSLGKDAIAAAGVIVCPGVAGTPTGERLGRGGGSYDRVLRRANPAATRCLLLYDDEVRDTVPAEPHDALIDAIVTPTRLIEASPGRPEHQRLVGG